MDENASTQIEQTLESRDDSTSPDQLFSVPCPATYCDGWSPSMTLTTSIEGTFQKIAAALQHQLTLEDNHRSRRAALNSSTFDVDAVSSTLAQDEDHMAAIRGFLNACLQSIPVIMRSTAESSAKAQQVFNTPELLESILINLDPENLLSALQINHITSKMISTTPTLQDVLHLRPAKDGYLKTLFDGGWGPFSGLSVTYHDPNYVVAPALQGETVTQVGNVITVSAQSDPAFGSYEIGALCRRILISQPPVQVMELSTNCCRQRYYPTDSVWETTGNAHAEERPVIRSESGLTVGDLYDAATKLQQEHLHCPHASEEQHRSDGTVQVQVDFEGNVKIKNDDPFNVRRIKQDTRYSLRQLKHSVEEQKLRVYVRAKKMDETP